ncbi:MAG: hypothetical protein WAZ60_23965 [Desulfosalsimonadaceae bacterium]
MSTEAYQRAGAREGRVWPVFVYSFPFNANQTTERGIVYGLYSGSYLNQHGYLAEVESAELANLLNDYNSKIAGLTTQEQVVVAEIASKRYLAGIDKVIHDQKMDTLSAKITAEDASWTAKIAALSADRAALDTLSAKVTAETEKTSARISEIQAYISTEGANLSEVDIQVAEKEIQSSKVDIEILDAANSILKIQADTVNAANQLIDIELQTARAKVDIAQTTATIAKIGLLDNELTVAQAQTEIAEGELPVSAARVTLAEAKSAEVDREIDHYETTLPAQLTTDLENKVILMNTKQAGREDDLDRRREDGEFRIANRLDESTLDLTLAGRDATTQATVDAKSIEVMGNKVFNKSAEVNAAVAATERILAATITTSLTHTIKKAP